MSAVYVFFTVTSGFPLISGLAKAFGVQNQEWALYIIRFLDACIYFWLPQINSESFISSTSTAINTLSLPNSWNVLLLSSSHHTSAGAASQYPAQDDWKVRARLCSIPRFRLNISLIIPIIGRTVVIGDCPWVAQGKSEILFHPSFQAQYFAYHTPLVVASRGGFSIQDLC